MALALLFPDDSVLYLDAIPNYSKPHSSQVSSHPIDNSANVTDHISKNNRTFTVQGIVSSADFQREYTRSLDILQEFENQIQSEFNNPVSPSNIQDNFPLSELLPGFVPQNLFGKNEADFETDEFRGYSHETARDLLNEAWDKGYLLTLLDYDYDTNLGRTVNVRQYENLVITNFNDNENVQTGDSLEFNITFQKVRFALLKEVDINVTASDVEDAASGESNEGSQSSVDGQDESNLNLYERYKATALEIVFG